MAAAKAAQVWPEGKEWGSSSATRGRMGRSSQGRGRSTRGLMVRLVHTSPSSMASRASSPAFRVGRQHSIRADSTIHSTPALPRVVKPAAMGSSQSCRSP